MTSFYKVTRQHLDYVHDVIFVFFMLSQKGYLWGKSQSKQLLQWWLNSNNDYKFLKSCKISKDRGFIFMLYFNMSLLLFNSFAKSQTTYLLTSGDIWFKSIVDPLLCMFHHFYNHQIDLGCNTCQSLGSQHCSQAFYTHVLSKQKCSEGHGFLFWTTDTPVLLSTKVCVWWP